MTTAQAYFEIYKALPPTTKSKILSMIISEKNMILSEIEQGLSDVKQMEMGLKPTQNIRDLIKELRNE
jgi:hypothetical protein